MLFGHISSIIRWKIVAMKKHLLYISFLLLALPVSAQRSFPISPALKTSVAAVHPNLVYIGFNNDGVKVFDGLKIDNPTFSLPTNRIRSLLYWQGNLWIGTEAGLYRVQGNTVTPYSVANNNLPGDTVFALTIFNGGLAIGTNNGLVLFNGQNWQNFNITNSTLPSNRITHLKGAGNALGILSNGHAISYQAGQFQVLMPQSSSAFTRIIPYQGGMLLSRLDSAFFASTSGSFAISLTNVEDWINRDSGDRILAIRDNKLFTYRSGEDWFRNLEQTTNNRGLITEDSTGMLHIITNTLIISLNNEVYYDQRLNSINSTHLDINEVRAFMASRGDLFYSVNTPFARYEVPKRKTELEPPKTTIFAGSLWIGGIDNTGTLRQSAQTYRQASIGGSAYIGGPLDANGNLDSVELLLNFDRIWKINRFDIETFKHAWQQGRVQNGSYIPPKDIREWPGIRPNTTQVLAPFVDVNNDGQYNYLDGDYPQIKGDQAAWWVFNDRTPNRTTGSAMGLEIACMAYAYVCDQATGLDTVLNYSTFMDYKITNRSTTTYDSTIVAVWIDGDLGNPFDDYVGMDVAGNGFYFYNGDDDDEGIQGYGINPPAQGIYLLKGPAANPGDGIDNNRNGVIDEAGEDIAMSSFIYFNNDPLPNGNPTTDQHFYNYSRSRWKDGVPTVYGGNGYPGSMGSTTTPARFMFPGASDPNGWGIGGSIQNPTPPPFNWSELATGATGNTNTPGDRRGVAGIGSFTFAPEQQAEFTLAFIFSRGNSGTAQGSVNKLLTQDAPLIKQWYAAGNFPSCLDLSTVSVPKAPALTADVRFYPNPAQNQLFVAVGDKGAATIQIYDMQGRLLQTEVLEAAAEHQLDISALPAGVYLLRALQNGQLKQQKLVKH